MVTNPIGMSFVKFYYLHSPKLADFIRDKESLKAVIRAGLEFIVWIIRRVMPSGKTSISPGDFS